MEFVSPFDQSAIRRVFVDAFHVRDICFLMSTEETAHACTQQDDSPAIDMEAQMLEAMRLLNRHPKILVQKEGSLVGFIDARCLNQLAARMWLFGLVGLIDRHFEVAIEMRHPDGQWQSLLSGNRLGAALLLQKEKSRQGSSADLLSCLQISDKISILLSDPQMALDLGFTSRRQMKQGMKALAMLRDHLAHNQDIFPHCMEAALGMAERLDSLLDGSRLRNALLNWRLRHRSHPEVSG